MPQKPIRLPTLKSLQVKNPNPKAENPCLQIMSGMLSCWASSGYHTAGCAVFEQQLRACMDKPKAARPPPNMINYHLMRFQKRVTGKAKTH